MSRLAAVWLADDETSGSDVVIVPDLSSPAAGRWLEDRTVARDST
jgi:hypothetical protein